MIREETLTVLRAVQAHGPIATKDLDALNLTGAKFGCKSAINLLLNAHDLIEIWDFEGNRQRYVIAAKGEKLLRMMDAAKATQPGQVPEPRTGPSKKPWKPKPWTPIRAGAEVAFQIPSRVDGELVDRKPPALICVGRVDAVGVHGSRV